ncbi:MAG: hypothetical protein K2M91_00915, partial [Lachnospiraceae bacterium]|nr:hypothetical protein [Lachnospiraceae bacterium]
MRKRLISMLLSVALVLTLVDTTIFATEQSTEYETVTEIQETVESEEEKEGVQDTQTSSVDEEESEEKIQETSASGTEDIETDTDVEEKSVLDNKSEDLISETEQMEITEIETTETVSTSKEESEEVTRTELISETEEEIDSHEERLNELEEEIEQLDHVIKEMQTIDTSGFKEKYGLSYEDLLFRCPEYLENDKIEVYLNKCYQYAAEIWDEAAVNEDTAKIMYNLKKGFSYNVKNLLGDVGVGNTEYEEFQIDMAKSVVKDYLKTDTAASEFYKDVADKLSIIDKVYNVMDNDKVGDYAAAMAKACKHLSQKDIEVIVENIKSAKSFMQYAGDASTAYKICSSIVAMQEIDMEAVDLLIECQTANYLSYLPHKYSRLKSNVLNIV